MIKVIKPDVLKDWLANNEVFLIDVREAAEHHAESIEQAKLMPLENITSRSIPETDKKIVLHCRAGIRSEKACKRLNHIHPELTWHMLGGGLDAWNKAGFKTIKASS